MTKFGSVTGNMCITGLYGYTVCQIIIYDSVGDSNFGMGVLHVKREILTYLLWRSLSVCSIFLFFHRIEYPKRCLWKKNKKNLSSSKAARRAGTLRNRWNWNSDLKNRDDNVKRAADDKIRADDDLMRISKFSKLKKKAKFRCELIVVIIRWTSGFNR